MKGSKDRFGECFFYQKSLPLKPYKIQIKFWGHSGSPNMMGKSLSCLFVCFSALFSCIVSYYLCQIVIDHVSQFCSSLFIVFNGFVGGLLAQMAWDGLGVQTMMDPFKSG